MTSLHPTTPFKQPQNGASANNPIPSSSPAFATPLNPPPPHKSGPTFRDEDSEAGLVETSAAKNPAPVLPILLPPATLRPIAFRTFTKKHNLTLTTPTLALLAAFIGKNCGSLWREDGLGELALEEIARAWKKSESGVIVEANDGLRTILRNLEAQMVGGRLAAGKRGLSRQDSLVTLESSSAARPPGVERNESQDSLGMSGLGVEDVSRQGNRDDDDDEDDTKDPRAWLKISSALERPRIIYNATRKHFEKQKVPASAFPPASAKTDLFRQRYHIIHQRLLRNESFQTPSTPVISHSNQAQQAWKITSIANLLGRSGSSHLLLGQLAVSPAGTLALNDTTGSIALDLSQAAPIDPAAETYLCPGMIVLVDGVYEEEFSSAGGTLGANTGIGGTIGGRFTGFFVGGPRAEPRAATLGLSSLGADFNTIGGGFGWVDFLGVGSERATGAKMRRLEQRLLRTQASSGHRHNSNKVVILGECNLDDPRTLSALRAILRSYAPLPTTTVSRQRDPDQDYDEDEEGEGLPPMTFVLHGSFTSHAALSGSKDTDSIAYKESFDALAALIADFHSLLKHTTWVFVPGENDPWASSFSSGASSVIPRDLVPDMFTSRVRREFGRANNESINIAKKEGRVPGEAIFTSNPSTMTLFGTAQEVVLFRDDMSGRMRRNGITIGSRAGKDESNKENEDVHMNRTTGTSNGQSEDVQMGNDANRANRSPTPIDVEESQSGLHTSSDMATKTRRNKFAKEGLTHTEVHARRITKTVLDQSHLSPFPLGIRPQHWGHAAALSLYPLPSALVLCDPGEGGHAEASVVTYQSCVVMNPASVVRNRDGRQRVTAQWIEYDTWNRRGVVKRLTTGSNIDK